MKILASCLVALAASASSFAQTTVPATPTLTAGAEFKGLRFDWEPAARASWYQLEYRAHQTGAFVQSGDDYPATATSTHFSFPLHLFDWTYARYRLAACNSAGCSRSAEVSVSTLRRFAVGYFKPSRTLLGIQFGDEVDLSPDGNQFVSASPGDFISVNGELHYGGAVYLFTRRPDGSWYQRARLEPTLPPFIEGSNQMRVAVSADGNTIALGMENYWHEEFDANPGEVFVLHYNGTKWTRVRVARVPADSFGFSVGLNDAGDTLTVGAGGRGISTALYKLVNGSWQNVRNFSATPTETGVDACGDAVLSHDGTAVVEFCRAGPGGTTDTRLLLRVNNGANWNTRTDMPLTMSAASPRGYASTGIAVDRDASTIAAQIYVPEGPPDFIGGPSQVDVFKRGSAGYSQVAVLTPGAWRKPDVQRFYGQEIAMSGDGATIAVGDPWDNGTGNGPRAAPLIAGDVRSGAAYIYRLSSTWKLANMVKPNVTSDARAFGGALALSNTGKTLIVGDIGDRSPAKGIGGNWQQTGGGSGAVWMY